MLLSSPCAPSASCCTTHTHRRPQPAAPRAPRPAPRASRLRASGGGEEPASGDSVAAALLADVCAELGARFELTTPQEEWLWEDDYQEVVTEGEDSWGREAFAVGEHSDAAPTTSARLFTDSAGSPLPPAPLRSAYSAERGFRDVTAAVLAAQLATDRAPLILDVRHCAPAQPLPAPALHVPLQQLSFAAAAGLLDAGRGGAGVVCVCDSGELAAQAAVRLTRVLGFTDVTALRGGVAELLIALRSARPL